MSSIDPATFFNVQGNLTNIKWAHAVNSKELLTQALEQANVSMLEADVVLGKLNNSEAVIPIMAHPPKNTSDLSLEAFLNTVKDKKNITKGVKLDFKTLEALNASKEILNKTQNDLKFPLFINADILPGPVNANTTPVDAKEFLTQTKSFKNCTLSVGWTTRYGSKDNVTEGGYTDEQIKEMVKVLKEQQVTQPITYPVRAGLAANSVAQIKMLMETPGLNTANVTLTVWSSEGDKVDVGKLSTLIKEVGVAKVYVDVPDDLRQNLTLSSAASVNAASFMLATSLLILLSGYL
ncbi:protein FAM151B isoform X2 [Ceratina calcarata]|nr:protein FAM151B isoform X2 [Ceratina calcarata]